MSVRTWAGICVLALAMGTAATVTAQASPSAAPQSSTGDGIIHLVAGGGGGGLSILQDFDHDGMGFGDHTLFRGSLTRPGGRRIGTQYGDCTFFSEGFEDGGRWLCHYLLDLAHGQITAEGLDPRGISDTIFSITGGTGDYRGASGQARFVDSESQTDIYIDLDG
jgi:hypothetical protein